METVRLARSALRMKPLSERVNKVFAERDFIPRDSEPEELDSRVAEMVAECAERVRSARAAGRPVIMAFGAHTIKNGLAPVIAGLCEDGWLTHLATNGAGIIHDWEFAFLGRSSEDVRENVARGEFGNWEETGHWINLAIAAGAYHGFGYGESVGAMICRDGVRLPWPSELAEAVSGSGDNPGRAAAAADLLGVVNSRGLFGGWNSVVHRWKKYSLQATAFRLGVQFTGHPMFGHDIIYNHPASCGAAIGRTAERDFLAYAGAVSQLEGGVYLSVGSAVMSPMIFEKSLSMARNLAIQRGEEIESHYIMVVDLAESRWDWSRGEPPADSPDYYLRYNKTFARMGGSMRYLSLDNRDFLLALHRGLSG